MTEEHDDGDKRVGSFDRYAISNDENAGGVVFDRSKDYRYFTSHLFSFPSRVLFVSRK